jgi:hypothetical protein
MGHSNDQIDPRNREYNDRNETAFICTLVITGLFNKSPVFRPILTVGRLINASGCLISAQTAQGWIQSMGH